MTGVNGEGKGGLFQRQRGLVLLSAGDDRQELGRIITDVTPKLEASQVACLHANVFSQTRTMSVTQPRSVL